MKHEAIKDAWAARKSLRDEGDKLRDKGTQLRIEGCRLYAEGDELRDESRKRYDEGHKRYIDAVVEKHGDKAVIDWETGKITTR